MLLELHEKISYSEKGKELNMGGRQGEARKSLTQGQCWEVDTGGATSAGGWCRSVWGWGQCPPGIIKPHGTLPGHPVFTAKSRAGKRVSHAILT